MMAVVTRALAGVRHVLWYLDFRTGGAGAVRELS
jgi:hypothetical protein